MTEKSTHQNDGQRNEGMSSMLYVGGFVDLFWPKPVDWGDKLYDFSKRKEKERKIVFSEILILDKTYPKLTILNRKQRQKRALIKMTK